MVWTSPNRNKINCVLAHAFPWRYHIITLYELRRDWLKYSRSPKDKFSLVVIYISLRAFRDCINLNCAHRKQISLRTHKLQMERVFNDLPKNKAGFAGTKYATLL